MPRSVLRRRGTEFCAYLAFFTRLPAPASGPPDFSCAWWALPSVGMLLGVLAGGIAAAAAALGMSPLLAGAFGALALVVLTGGFHEDGLADFCDALGGGSREKRLAIMRDSRLGTFGGLALIFSVLLRTTALADLLGDGLLAGWTAFVGAGAVSRAAAVAPLAFLPPARIDGLGAAAIVTKRSCCGAFLIGVAVAAMANGAISPMGTLFAVLCALIATAGTVRVARRALGGQTGDVAGAASQCAEIAFLVGLATFVRV